jgi:hypothetical protein
MGRNEQNVVERQRFLQNTHGLSFTQSGIIRAALLPGQSANHQNVCAQARKGTPSGPLGRNLPTDLVPFPLTRVGEAANFMSALILLRRDAVFCFNRPTPECHNTVRRTIQ